MLGEDGEECQEVSGRKSEGQCQKIQQLRGRKLDKISPITLNHKGNAEFKRIQRKSRSRILFFTFESA